MSRGTPLRVGATSRQRVSAHAGAAGQDDLVATYLAFLRAINLGAHRRFGKDDVRRVTEGAGFSEVVTHLNTGNVRGASRHRGRERVEEVLERAYLADRGFEVPTIAFTAAEFAALADRADEVAAGHPGRHYVSLLKAEPDAAAVEALQARAAAGERVVVDGRFAHLLLGEDYRSARLDNALAEKVLGVATNRNATVIRALAAKWC